MKATISNSTVLNSIMELNDKTTNDNKLLWKLYNVAVWENVYNVKPDSTVLA